MAEQSRQQVERKVDRTEQRYQDHGKVFRGMWVAAGVTVILAGLALTVFPGPAIVVIPVGLAMLSAEFAWARRLLKAGLKHGAEVKDKLDHTPQYAKTLGGLALASLVAAVVALIVLR